MSGIIRNALSISDKLSILKTYDEKRNLKNQTQIAADLNIPSSTLRTILKKRKEIEEKAVQGATKRKKIKHGKFAELESVLLQWFHQARSSQLPLNGTLITEKAREIAKELQISDFTGSNGWIDRFKTRHGIVYRQASAETKSINKEDAGSWKETILSQLLKDFSARDVFTADEFGLLFKLMPDESVVYKNDKSFGGNLINDRLSVLACANADGSEKMRLLVIGKAKSPRCFKNVRTFPCDYASQRSALMTSEQFVLWAERLDATFRSQDRKVLLLVNNCSAHPKAIELSNVKLICLPSNAASKLQPMNQGIINTVKRHYRRRLVHRYLSTTELGEPPPPVNILDAINYITAAWDAIRPAIIKNCFVKAGIESSGNTPVLEPDDVLDEDAVFPNFSDYVSVDDDIATYEEVRTVRENNGLRIKDEEAEEETEEEPAPTPTSAAALAALADVRRFVSSMSELSDDAVRQINYLETFILNSSFRK